VNQMLNLTVHIDPPEVVVKPIAEGLRRFNEEHVGSVKPLVLVISASDAEGDIVGGIKGLVLWGWVYVEQLWVHEEHRGTGIGGALLEHLESEALARGAKRSVLLSASWQAPEFYRSRGYETVATFDLEISSGPRCGHETDYLFVKSLQEPGMRAV
jgi:GNAT superfamily N-acetyltransferase